MAAVLVVVVAVAAEVRAWLLAWSRPTQAPSFFTRSKSGSSESKVTRERVCSSRLASIGGTTTVSISSLFTIWIGFRSVGGGFRDPALENVLVVFCRLFDLTQCSSSSDFCSTIFSFFLSLEAFCFSRAFWIFPMRSSDSSMSNSEELFSCLLSLEGAVLAGVGAGVARTLVLVT